MDFGDRLSQFGDSWGVVLVAITVLILIAAGFWALIVQRRKAGNLKTMKADLKAIPIQIGPITEADAKDYSLRDFYIASSLNSCCSGSGDIYTYVGLDPLKAVIAHGARALDFEVFSVEGAPVVSTSLGKTNSLKATLNAVSFDDAMVTAARYAFNSGGCPNAADPLIINIRMSTSKDVYQSMANSIRKAFGSNHILPHDPHDSNGENVGSLPMSSLIASGENSAKVIVFCTGYEDKYRGNEDFYSLISGSGSGIFIRKLSHYDVLYGAGNEPELTEYNKKNMSLVVPQAGEEVSIKASIPMHYGCQMVFMDYSQPDTNFAMMMMFFNEAGSAFVLKPELQRYIPVTISAPPPQNPDLSYAPKTLTKPYFSAKI